MSCKYVVYKHKRSDGPDLNKKEDSPIYFFDNIGDSIDKAQFLSRWDFLHRFRYYVVENSQGTSRILWEGF